MEVLALLIGLAVVLWFFIARPRKQALRYQVHKDALQEASAFLTRVRSGGIAPKWPFNGEVFGSLVENIDCHVNNTAFGELGSADLDELVKDLTSAHDFATGNIEPERRERIAALEYDRFFGHLSDKLGFAMFSSGEHSGRHVTNGRRANKWAGSSSRDHKIPLAEAKRLLARFEAAVKKAEAPDRKE